MNAEGVSFVIPCHNAGAYLTEAVGSIRRQSIRHSFEILVVDDASSDRETREALNTLERDHSAEVFRLPIRAGAQSARNVAVKQARYSYICCVDADDKLADEAAILKEGTYVDRAIDMLSNDPTMAFVHCPWQMFGDFSGLTISAYPVTTDLILRKHHVPISIVYRMEDGHSAGGYDETITKWQDWSFAIGLLNARFTQGKKTRIGYLNEAYYLYRIHSAPTRLSSAPISELEMVRRTVSKHPDIFEASFGLADIDSIADRVFRSKPSKLKDLLLTASYDLGRALRMAAERDAMMVGNREPPGIP